jgi:hypothetical protein
MGEITVLSLILIQSPRKSLWRLLKFLYLYWVTTIHKSKYTVTQGDSMKKYLILCVLAIILATGAVFADHPGGMGIGVVGSYGWGSDMGAALSVKFPSVPVFWAVTADFGSTSDQSHINIGVIGDYYLIDMLLIKEIGLHWFLGLGGWAQLNSHTWKYLGREYNSTGFAFGARLPIGLSWQPVPLFELFLDVAPRLGVAFSPEVKSDSGYVLKESGAEFPVYGYPLELGIRIWF